MIELSSIGCFRKSNIRIKDIELNEENVKLGKLNSVIEKIRRRKVIAAIALVCIIAFSVVYALTQMKTGFAILTTPPPGIPGSYYVTAEAKIYGPVVDLAAIKSKMNGTYAPDYTYVQWGTNPFYRVYVDNTFQEVYYGQMMDVMDKLSIGFTIENNLANTFISLKNVGAVDPTSIFGEIRYFGNMPGDYLVFYTQVSGQTCYINVTGQQWYATEAHADPLALVINSTGSSAGFYRWKFTANFPGQITYGVYLNDTTCLKGDSGNTWYGGSNGFGVTLYFQEITLVETIVGGQNLKVYEVIDSPGTGFVSKYVSPSSPVIGSTLTITVRLDPPAASKMNITDKYPNTFTWAGGQVTLQKYRVGAGLVASASVSVTPTPDGSNMKFTVYYNQAVDVLQSLLGDEYVYLSYTITAPSTMGEYTLPAATMSYLIPTP
jgi:hypothetical protein